MLPTTNAIFQMGSLKKEKFQGCHQSALFFVDLSNNFNFQMAFLLISIAIQLLIEFPNSIGMFTLL